ncbi:unnamed protein product [Cylicostephanus goldi]|uniref:Jumonji helical domain-containing protein n=1 Tax=Cylicostephanus goldi TaxID=71465 RepID=A0A3P6Q5Y1_CYLGO|nr:unnamed protein product [Cylicostephanus goldi]
MEQRLKKVVGTEEKFLFPHFELVNWYAARSLILEQLREANDEGNRADQYILDAATALMPCLKEWMRRDKEAKMNSTTSFNDVLVKLQREINKQHYASTVVEKPDPMLEEVNMTQMFARRSSSGRQPRPSAWLAEAVGLDELEKTAKKLEGLSFAMRYELTG